MTLVTVRVGDDDEGVQRWIGVVLVGATKTIVCLQNVRRFEIVFVCLKNSGRFVFGGC